MKTLKFVKIADIAAKINSLFEFEKRKLAKLLPSANIDHIGGTSVPGSISRGDLDINVRVESEDFEKAIEILKKLYQINQPENWSTGFASFKDDARDLGIQLTALGSTEDYFVAQREYLKNHPEMISKLNVLKESFQGKGIDEYRKEKAKFFELINTEVLMRDI